MKDAKKINLRIIKFILLIYILTHFKFISSKEKTVLPNNNSVNGEKKHE